MATVIGRGGAAAVSQVTDWTFSGTWASGASTVTFTIGTRSVSIVTGSTVISTLLDTLVAAWNLLSSTLYPEFAELTASKDGTTDFRLTAGTAGKPFTVALATNDGTGVIGSATAITANSGPNDWNTAANWSTGTVPVSTDDVVFENSAWNVYYGLDQNAVDLTSITFKQSWTGRLGLPLLNTDGGTELGAGAYSEYRERYLKIGYTTGRIGEGEGGGSPFLNLNGDGTAFTLTVFNSGQSEDTSRGAISILGTNVANVIHVLKGSVDIAYEAGTTVGLATLNVAFRDNPAGDSIVRCGTGVAPLTAVNVRGGVVELNSNAVTIIQTDGELSLNRAMTVTTQHIQGGICYDATSGTTTTVNVSGPGVLDYRRATVAKTATTVSLYAGATLRDPYRRIAFGGSVINLVQCGLEDVTIDFGKNIQLGRTLL